MSTIKDADTKEMLNRLKYAMKFNTWIEVADYLGESPATVSGWLNRNSPSARDKILLRSIKDVPEKFLIYGTGPTRIFTVSLEQSYDIEDNSAGDKVLTASHGSAAISAGGQVTNTQHGNQPIKELETDELSAIEKTFLQILRRRPDGEELLEHYLSEVLKPYGK